MTWWRQKRSAPTEGDARVQFEESLNQSSQTNAEDDVATDHLRSPFSTAREEAESSRLSLDEVLASRRSVPFEVRYPTAHCLDEAFCEQDLANLPLDVQAHIQECAVCASIVEATAESTAEVDTLMKAMRERVLHSSQHVPRSDEQTGRARAHSPQQIEKMVAQRRAVQDRPRLIAASIEGGE